MMASAGNGKRQGQNREAKRKRKTKRRKAAASISSPQGPGNTGKKNPVKFMFHFMIKMLLPYISKEAEAGACTIVIEELGGHGEGIIVAGCYGNRGAMQNDDGVEEDGKRREMDGKCDAPCNILSFAYNIYFLRFVMDPDAEFCCICGDDEEDGEHSELNCPYNYLSPASYVPCRARLTIWNDEVFKPYQTFGRFPKPTRQDRAFARRRVVRVTNLPPSCCRPASAARRLITGLFAQFGPLRMYHVVEEEDDDEEDVCVGGIGCVVFDRREDAEKAIDELNCYVVDGHSLRVDWVYPYCGKKVAEAFHLVAVLIVSVFLRCRVFA
uniref:RRM domain-containing protein n=1 Tax=Oryza meridionalis TaxID=40149 RepID=A0A0E0ERL0_9ORYZ